MFEFDAEKRLANDMVNIAWQGLDPTLVELMKAMILLAGRNNGQVNVVTTDAGSQVVGLSRGGGAAWDTTDGRTQATLQAAIGKLKEGGQVAIMNFAGGIGKLTKFGYDVLDELQGK